MDARWEKSATWESVCLLHHGGRSGRLLGSPSSRKIFMVTVGSVAQRKGKKGLYKVDIQIQIVRKKRKTPNMNEEDGGDGWWKGGKKEGFQGIANRGNRSC